MPNYKASLRTIEDFILMSYGPLTTDKIRRLKDVFDYFKMTDYLEMQMGNFESNGIPTEDTFLGIWKYLHEDTEKLVKELDDELKLDLG